LSFGCHPVCSAFSLLRALSLGCNMSPFLQ
jgi:hypothetical protein